MRGGIPSIGWPHCSRREYSSLHSVDTSGLGTSRPSSDMSVTEDLPTLVRDRKETTCRVSNRFKGNKEEPLTRANRGTNARENPNTFSTYDWFKFGSTPSSLFRYDPCFGGYGPKRTYHQVLAFGAKRVGSSPVDIHPRHVNSRVSSQRKKLQPTKNIVHRKDF
jgi:hypothetical protein